MTTEEEFSDTEREEARKLFAGPCDFMLGVAHLEQLPPADKPEIAFAGRSNVGKSSLVNALTGRKALARTSHTPGRTQQLNYFNLGDVMYLVDLPGYGYAKVSKKQKKEWNFLIRDYLRGRPTLRCVFMLIDARHGIKDADEEIMKLLDESAVSYRIILTKTDKTKEAERQALREKIRGQLRKHGAAIEILTFTSAHKNFGIDELQMICRRYAV